MQRKLWIDTRGEPVITTAPNGERNARRWGWVEGEVIPKGDLTACPTNPKVDALRDYLLAELGLWRDDETGALVVVDSWDGSSARVIALPDDGDGYVYAPPLGILDSDAPDRCDAVVTRWRASLTPPPREPKPGEVWRITLEDGTSHNVLVQEYAAGAVCFEDGSDGGWYVSGFPADRRRLLVEADGTVVSDE